MGHFGKHRDDKSDYWNRRNQEKVKNLEKQWEREKADERLKELVQATWKEFALDPSLGVAGAFGGGRPMFRLPGQGEPSGASGICSTNPDGCMLGGALLILAVDGLVGLPLFAVIVSTGGVTPPAIAAHILEVVVVLPVNIFGIYLIAEGRKVKNGA